MINHSLSLSTKTQKTSRHLSHKTKRQSKNLSASATLQSSSRLSWSLSIASPSHLSWSLLSIVSPEPTLSSLPIVSPLTSSLPTPSPPTPSPPTPSSLTPSPLKPTLRLPSLQPERENTLPTLCLVYITLGCTVVLMLTTSLCLFYFCKRRQRRKELRVFSYCPSEQETSRTSLSNTSRRQDFIHKEAYVPSALYPPNFSNRRSHLCPSPFETGSETDQYSLSAFHYPRLSQGTLGSLESSFSIYSPFSDTWEAKRDSL